MKANDPAERRDPKIPDDSLGGESAEPKPTDNSGDSRNEPTHGVPAEGNNTDGAEQIDFHKIKRAIAFLDDIRHLPVDSQVVGDDSTQARQGSTGDTDQPAPFEGRLTPITQPDRVGRFEVIRLIGRGGFSQVFLAHDPKLDRQVALKVPTPETLGSPAGRERFQREARAAAKLKHPAIVPIFESGSAGSVDFIAYEYCSGVTLAQWFDQQGRCLAPELGARIVMRLAEAVDEAHRLGVIHRDLKPSNVLIDSHDHQQDVADCLKITDFGLAKQTLHPDDQLTTEGAVIGTPAYMSPEQAGGNADVGSEADIFSLGVILYEILSGQLPFKKESHIETMVAVRNETPRELRSIRSTIPKDLSAICQKCLEKSPAQRYRSAEALARDLMNWLEGRPVSVRYPGPLTRSVRWVQKNAIKSLIGALGIVLVTVVLLVVINMSRRINDSQQQLDLQQQTITLQSEELDDLVKVSLDHLINEFDLPPHALAEQQASVRRSLEVQLRRLASETTDRSVNLASRGYYELAKIYFLRGHPEYSIESARDGLHVLQRHSAPHSTVPVLLALNLNRLLTDAYLRSGDYSQASQCTTQYQTLVERLSRDTESGSEQQRIHVSLVRIGGKLLEGRVSFHQQQYEDAVSAFSQARSQFVKLPSREHWTRFDRDGNEHLSAEIDCWLARSLGPAGKSDEAVELIVPTISQTRTLIKKYPLRSHYKELLGIALYQYSLDLNTLGQKRDSLEPVREAREIFSELAENYPDNKRLALQLARAGNNLGLTYYELKQWEDSEAVWREHWQQLEAMPPDSLVPLAQSIKAKTQRLLARQYLQQKKNEETAFTLLNQAVSTSRQLVAENPSHAKIAAEFSAELYQLGVSELQRGQPMRAIQLLNEGVEFCNSQIRQKIGPRLFAHDLLRFYTSLSSAYFAIQRFKDARNCARYSTTIFSRAAPPREMALRLLCKQIQQIDVPLERDHHLQLACDLAAELIELDAGKKALFNGPEFQVLTTSDEFRRRFGQKQR